MDTQILNKAKAVVSFQMHWHFIWFNFFSNLVVGWCKLGSQTFEVDPNLRFANIDTETLSG